MKGFSYRNTHVAEALIEGLIFCAGGAFELDDPDHDGYTFSTPDWDLFISPYAGDDPPPPKYEWGYYNYVLRMGRDCLRSMQVRNNGEIPRGRVDKNTRDYERHIRQAYLDATDPREFHEAIISDGIYVVRYHLTALLLAHNGHPKLESDYEIPRLVELLGSRLQSSGVSPRIEWLRYNDPDFVRSIPQSEFVESVIHDAGVLRTASNRVKRAIDAARRAYERSL